MRKSAEQYIFPMGHEYDPNVIFLKRDGKSENFHEKHANQISPDEFIDPSFFFFSFVAFET